MKNNLSDKNNDRDIQSDFEPMYPLGTRCVRDSNSPVLRWTCKARASAGKYIFRVCLVMFITATGLSAMGLWRMWENFPKNIEYFYVFSLSVYAVMGLFILAFAQRTVYHYDLNSGFGVCDSCLNFPSWSGGVFKGIAIVALLIVLGMAIAMGSIAPLLGAGALGLGYAGRLLGWKNEVNVELSQPWNEHAFLTLDYKRKIIVTHHSNMLYGFELRFPDQALFDECLAFLKTVLPDNIEVLVKDWDSHDACRLDG